MTKRHELLFGIATAEGAHRAMVWFDGMVIFKGRPYTNRKIAVELSQILRSAVAVDGEKAPKQQEG